MKRCLALLILCFPVLLQAHIGSPDVFLQGDAGPYKLFVTVRPPQVIPGVAEVDVRSESPDVKHVTAVPLPMTGVGAKLPPTPETLTPAKDNAQFFAGTLWLMAPGSWQVRVAVSGDKGPGVLSIPVPSAALRNLPMQRGLGALLLGLGGFLVIGAVAMTGAAVREAKLAPGTETDARPKRKGQIAMAVAAALIAFALWQADRWWGAEASSAAAKIYKPLNMAANVQGSTLTLDLSDPGWLNQDRLYKALDLPVQRSVDDLVLDHDHLMHLYLLREPDLDVVYHLHPDQAGPGEFRLDLPSMPAGTYNLYADIVHQNGFPETLTARISVPDIHGRALAGDDAKAQAPSWRNAAVSSTFTLPDGYRMQWVNKPAKLEAQRPMLFKFALTDSKQQAPADMALYMGMLGHAAFVKTDGTVFAHIHPNGSVAMAAYMKAQGMPMDMDMSPTGPLPNVVSFPYGLPTRGRYRIFVQMKHGSTVETGVFDASAE